MQNVHGKEIDLLRTTVKVPGKRPPRAVSSGAAAVPSPSTNGLTKDLNSLQLGQTSGQSSGQSGPQVRPQVRPQVSLDPGATHLMSNVVF